MLKNSALQEVRVIYFCLNYIAEKARYLCKKNNNNSDYFKVITSNENLTLEIDNQFTLTFKNTQSNFKIFSVMLNMIKRKDGGRAAFSFQKIAEIFDYEDRQNIHNFSAELAQAGHDIGNFLNRKSFLEGSSEIIEKQVLSNVLLPLSEHHRIFNEKNKDLEMSYTPFLKRVDQIKASSVIESFKKLFSDKIKSGGINVLDTLELISNVKDKSKIIDPLLTQSHKPYKFVSKCGITKFAPNLDRINRSLLVNFLSASGLSYEIIGMLLNVSKGTVSNLFHNIQDMQSLLINSIKSWSGKISIDEKYIKINQVPHYVITIVDFITGIPLYKGVYPNTSSESFEHCFQMFRQFYGKPKLIVSDGSTSLAKARNTIFSEVPYQLCKFHKMKNLIKELYKTRLVKGTHELYKNKIVNIFRRKSSKSRKKGLVKLIKELPESLGKYIQDRILKDWKARSKGLTSNVSERYNRKIKKAVSGRYGLKSLETAQQIVFSLWMKELILHGRSQLHAESIIFNLNITEICQENIKWKHVESLFSKKLDKAVGY